MTTTSAPAQAARPSGVAQVGGQDPDTGWPRGVGDRAAGGGDGRARGETSSVTIARPMPPVAPRTVMFTMLASW
jgi:hypothetical protein